MDLSTVAALDWVSTVTGRRVTRVRRLRGGLTSDVRAVSVDNGETLVLRRYTEWGSEAAEPVRREAATLTRLAQMARMLATVHALPPTAPAPNRPPLDPAELSVPDWTARPGLWKRAIAVLATPPSPFTPAFVHSDYQHFNMLWSRGRLTGLIDWVFAGTDHPDVDTAHCRLNLAVLFSVDHAERFRVLYEAESGRKIDPWWDLRGADGADTRPDLTQLHYGAIRPPI